MRHPNKYGISCPRIEEFRVERMDDEWMTREDSERRSFSNSYNKKN